MTNFHKKSSKKLLSYMYTLNNNDVIYVGISDGSNNKTPKETLIERFNKHEKKFGNNIKMYYNKVTSASATENKLLLKYPNTTNIQRVSNQQGGSKEGYVYVILKD